MIRDSDFQWYVKDKKHWLYNTRNDRMIVSEQPLENYLNDIENSSNPLYEFSRSPRPKNKVTNIHIIRFVLKSSKIQYLHKFVLFLNKWYVTALFLAVNMFYLGGMTEYFPKSASEVPIFDVILVYLIMSVIILPIHEYAHFSVYYDYFKPSKVVFGLSIRYFSIPVFFTKVPFYRLMEKKEKRQLILAGIKIQIFIWVVLTLLMLTCPSTFIATLLIVNMSAIVVNLLPFLRLDGYWYINELLRVEDYMNYFRGIVLKKQVFRLDIFILGLINIAMIVFSIFYTIFEVINIFI